MVELSAAPSTAPSIIEALNRYLAAKKNGKKALEGHNELARFVSWCGRERRVSDITPAEIEEYAKHVGQSGSESLQRLNPVKTFLGYWKDEGWVQTGLATHLRIPRTRRLTPATNRRTTQTTDDSTQLSQEGFERLKNELDQLKEERFKVVEDIKLAMADKDFRENSPLDAAKERQGIIESKIRELEDIFNNVQIIEHNSGRVHQRVAVGSKVCLKEAASGKQLVYTLVDVREANVADGKISNASLVGQALLGRSVGEEVVIQVPKGTLRYVIERIGS